MAYKKEDLQIKDKIGEGQLGDSYEVEVKTKKETVIMKVLKHNFTSATKEPFLKQINPLKELKNTNVVRYLDFVEMGDEKVRILMENMNKGSLVKLVRGKELNDQAKIRLLLHACRGLQYLHSQKIVHGNVAARNILVARNTDGSTVAKISDYGIQGDMKLPVEWMSPERIKTNSCSAAGDVWAFGIAIWEVFSGGVDPYLDCPAADEGEESLAKFICDGGHPNKPTNNCPEDVWQLMLKTWVVEESKRISLDSLTSELKKNFEANKKVN